MPVAVTLGICFFYPYERYKKNIGIEYKKRGNFKAQIWKVLDITTLFEVFAHFEIGKKLPNNRQNFADLSATVLPK